MKKIFITLLVVILTFGLFAGCGKKDDEQTPANNNETSNSETSLPSEYEDGIYFATEEDFSDSGWKYAVTIEVENGEFVSVDWNGANKNGGKDKKTSSADGDYGMVEKGGAQAEWHEQAEKTEAYLLETQDPTAISYTSDEGHTDDIAGVSIHVVEFYNLVEKALSNGPVEVGHWQDGTFYAEEDDFNKGYKYTVSLTVINGNIVAANWDAISEEDEKTKKQASIDGEYGMDDAPQGPWFEQAAAVEAYLLETQDPTAVTLDEDGNSDDIAGASITVSTFFELADEALQAR
ncbi:MAG: hypothetical protein ACLFMO_00540 [Eubacteriales bacterium]